MRHAFDCETNWDMGDHVKCTCSNLSKSKESGGAMVFKEMDYSNVISNSLVFASRLAATSGMKALYKEHAKLTNDLLAVVEKLIVVARATEDENYEIDDAVFLELKNAVHLIHEAGK